MSVKITPHYDAATRQVTIAETQDCEPHLEYNRALQGTPHNRKADLRHYAHTPNIWINKWLHEEWARGNVSLKPFGKEFDEMMARKLRDPENAWMLTGPTGTAYKQGHKCR